MDQFVLERLVDMNVSLVDTIKEVKLSTFSSLKETAKIRPNSGETLRITTDTAWLDCGYGENHKLERLAVK